MEIRRLATCGHGLQRSYSLSLSLNGSRVLELANWGYWLLAWCHRLVSHRPLAEFLASPSSNDYHNYITAHADWLGFQPAIWRAGNAPSKFPRRIGDLDPPSNTWFPGTTQVHTPDGISMFSRFYRAQDCDRQTDRQTTLYFVTVGRMYLRSSEMRPNNNLCNIVATDGILTTDTISVKFILSTSTYISPTNFLSAPHIRWSR